MRGMKSDYSTIKKVAPGFGAAANDFQFVGCKLDRVQMREIAGQDFTLTVDKSLPGVALNSDAQFPVNRVTPMHDAMNRCNRSTKGYRFVKMSRAKGPGVREDLDRFKPIGLTLTVVTVENVNSVCAIDTACEVAEAIDGN